MEVHRDPASLSVPKPVVTVGIFDGVHTGHRFIIRKLIGAAARMNGNSMILTMWPHPRLVLDEGGQDVGLLTTLEEKISLLGDLGVGHLVILDFSRPFSRMTSCEFVDQILVDRIGISHLLVGYNHRFGRDREGDIGVLRRCAKGHSFTLEQLPPYRDGELQISSSSVRKLLAEGEVSRANKMLGYRYFMSGTVIRGNGQGRGIGFPTANISPEDPQKLLPGDGVYAVYAEIGGRVMKGMMNIGFRPTVKRKGDGRVLEVHVFGLNREVYSETVRIRFQARLRDEIKFSGIDELRDQLSADKAKALELLEEQDEDPTWTFA